MKNITISQLKSRTFNMNSIIENNVQITPENIKENKKGLYEVIENLESLKEALFFKKEKLNKELSSSHTVELRQNTMFLENKISEITMEPLGNLKEILSHNKEIEDLKTEHKIINVLSEIEAGDTNIVENLFNSDDLADCKFLCKFLNDSIEAIENEQDEKLMNLLTQYFKRIEERLVEVFQQAKLESKKDIMRESYNCIKILNKGHSIIHCFINNLKIFQEPFEDVVNDEPENIDLDLYENDSNLFFQFIKKIHECYENDLSDISSIFSDYQDVLNGINSRIFEELIAIRLEKFLVYENPTLYLLNIKEAYKKVKTLCNYINSIYQGWDGEDALEELFEPHLTVALKKEVRVFDELYEIIVRNRKTKCNYLLMGSSLNDNQSNHRNSFKKLLCIINYTVERDETLKYKGDEISVVYRHFIRKIGDFCSTMVIDYISSENLKLCMELGEFYLIFKKYWQSVKENSNLIEDFSIFMENKIQSIYEARLKESKSQIKRLIKYQSIKEYLTESKNTNTIKTLIGFLKDEIAKTRQFIQGKNGHRFSIAILNHTYLSYYKNILGFAFDSKKANVLVNDAEALLSFVRDVNVVELIQNFEYLLSITQLIAVQKDNINIFLGGVFHKIPKDELKSILKTRNDYQSIKGVLQHI